MSALSLQSSNDGNPRDFNLSGYVLSLKLGNNLVARRWTFSIAIMSFLYKSDHTDWLHILDGAVLVICINLKTYPYP